MTVGTNVTVKPILFPGCIVTGKEIPLSAKAGLLIIAVETVTLEVPAVSCPA
jgi:hypothetical protein